MSCCLGQKDKLIGKYRVNSILPQIGVLWFHRFYLKRITTLTQEQQMNANPHPLHRSWFPFWTLLSFNGFNVRPFFGNVTCLNFSQSTFGKKSRFNHLYIVCSRRYRGTEPLTAVLSQWGLRIYVTQTPTIFYLSLLPLKEIKILPITKIEKKCMLIYTLLENSC